MGIVLATGQVRELGHIPAACGSGWSLSAVATGSLLAHLLPGAADGQDSYVAPIDKSSLAMILVLSVLFLGEPLTWKSALGTLAVLPAISVCGVNRHIGNIHEYLCHCSRAPRP